MTMIEFDTPTLNEKGEIIGQTGHHPEQSNAFGLYDRHGTLWEWCAGN
jgi:formylglycine-generating enzyme required for sulfatase activity